MKSKFILVLLFLFQSCFLGGQIHLEMEKVNVDSLQQILPKLNGKEKIDAINRISMASCADDTESSLNMANLAFELSEKLNYQKGKAESLFNLGNAYYIFDDFRPTLNNYLKALRIYEELPPSIEFGIVYLQLGDLNSFTGRYRESLTYHQKAFSIFDKLDNANVKIRTTALIAYDYSMIGDYDSTHYYTKKGLSYISPDGDPNQLAMFYQQFARTFKYQFHDTGDTSFLDKAIQWLSKAKNLPGLDCYQKSCIHFNLGNCSLSYKEISKEFGVAFFLKTIPIANKCKEACFVAPDVYRRLGKYRYEQGDLDTALILLNKALELIEEELSGFSIKDYNNPVRANESRWFLRRYKTYTYNNMYHVYSKRGNYQKALEFYILWKEAREGQYEEKHQNLITLLEAESENEKTNKKIALLAQNNELNEMKVAQSRIFNIGVAAIFLVLVLVGFLFLRQNKLKNEHKSTLLEQKLLRLQMNPHFIFNAFSNILRLIDTNDNKRASAYLTTFGKLLRTTLESTREDMVPFETEVGTLRNYLELQKLRYPEKLEFSLEVDEKIDQEDMSIPPMLVQPFIENAIEHGIRHKTTTGRIDVRFALMNKKIICEVEDDGVGREKAWEAEYTERGNHKSLATQIIRDRIQILNKKFKQKIKLEIIDIKSEQSEILGTKVLLDLPYGSVY